MPTYTFGKRTGATYQNNHKDTSVNKGSRANNSKAGDQNINASAYNGDPTGWILMRFDLPDIPAGETIDSATLKVICQSAPPSTVTIDVHEVVTPYGVTDTNEGSSESPATGGQATFDRAKDYAGGGGDVEWATFYPLTSRYDFGSSDYDASVMDSFQVLSTDTGTEFEIDVTDYVTNVHGGGTNAGIVMLHNDGSGAVGFWIWSQDAGTAANRPLLTVETSVAATGIVVPFQIFKPQGVF